MTRTVPAQVFGDVTHGVANAANMAGEATGLSGFLLPCMHRSGEAQWRPSVLRCAIVHELTP